MKCIARCKTNIFKQCNHLQNCNGYCKKHQNYSGKTINEPLYSIDEIKLFIYNCTYITSKIIINKTIKSNILITKYILQIYNYKYNDKLNVTNTVTYFKEFIYYYKNE